MKLFVVEIGDVSVEFVEVVDTLMPRNDRSKPENVNHRQESP